MYKAIVVHSGGMDSSLCLKLASDQYGKENVLSLSFSYGQRHLPELTQAEKICTDWGITHEVIDIPYLKSITSNALLDDATPISDKEEEAPNTFVVGRNGLMARLAAIYAHQKQAHEIWMGVMELEVANSGYPDCSRDYMDKMEEILQIDLFDPNFAIKTPLVAMTKLETMELAKELGILEYLWEETISCYEGIRREGCGKCPACVLRNEGWEKIRKSHATKASTTA